MTSPSSQPAEATWCESGQHWWTAHFDRGLSPLVNCPDHEDVPPPEPGPKANEVSWNE